MDKRLNAIVILVLCSFCIYLMIQDGCKGTPKSYNLSKSDTLYVVDTSKHVNNYYMTRPTTIIEHSVPAKVDTAATLSAFYAENVYDTTLSDNKDYKLRLLDTITRNRFKRRYFELEITRPTQIITNTTEVLPYKTHLTAGLRAGAGLQGNVMLMPVIGIDGKNKHSADIGYDFFGKRAEVTYKYHLRR